MPLGHLQQPLSLQDGTKVKMDLDGVKIFRGTISLTESDKQMVERMGYNPDKIVAVNYWWGRAKAYDVFPKARIIAVNHPDDTKFTTVREHSKDRPDYSKVQVVGS